MNLWKNLNCITATLTVVTGFAALMVSGTASAAFTPFVIRSAPTINVSATSTEFIIGASGEKAGFGSNDINGATLGDITGLKIDRLDDETRFTAGSGPNVAPYLNFWITDGTNYAVVANEPSNPAFQPLYNDGYDLNFADLSDKVAKIYEITDISWLPDVGSGPGVGLTFADLAAFQIQAPTVAELTTGWGGLGTGAPRELGTNIAYGVNWVFGDTLSNYVSGQDGYIVANDASVSIGVSAVPVPAAVWLFGSGLLGLAGMAKRKKAA